MKIRSNQIIPGAFGLMASLKFFLIFRESRVNENLVDLLPGALMYLVMFGSPQIFWLCITLKAMEKSQLSIAIVVLFVFIISASYFGFIPGMTRPSWGGDGYWEVPAAFISEWLIAFIFFVPFLFVRSKNVVKKSG